MRISVLLFQSSTTGTLCFYPKTKISSEYARIRDLVITELVSNDMVVVHHVPHDLPMDKILGEPMLVHHLVNVLRSCVGTSCDIQLTLINSYGYILRLTGMATQLKDAVNKIESLKGSTVIANVEVAHC